MITDNELRWFINKSIAAIVLPPKLSNFNFVNTVKLSHSNFEWFMTQLSVSRIYVSSKHARLNRFLDIISNTFVRLRLRNTLHVNGDFCFHLYNYMRNFHLRLLFFLFSKKIFTKSMARNVSRDSNIHLLEMTCIKI